MARIVIATLLTSIVILCFIWWPSAQTETKGLIPPKETRSEIRETATWLISTVNGVVLIVAALKRRRYGKRKR